MKDDVLYVSALSRRKHADSCLTQVGKLLEWSDLKERARIISEILNGEAAVISESESHDVILSMTMHPLGNHLVQKMIMQCCFFSLHMLVTIVEHRACCLCC